MRFYVWDKDVLVQNTIFTEWHLNWWDFIVYRSIEVTCRKKKGSTFADTKNVDMNDEMLTESSFLVEMP